MKVWKKVLLIISGVALVLGICCIVLGLILGGRTNAIRHTAGDYFNIGFGNHSFDIWDDWRDDFSVGNETTREFSNIEELDIESKYGDIIIKEYDGPTIKVTSQRVNPLKYSAEEDGYVLTITDHTVRSSNHPKITIQIPKDYHFTDVSIGLYGGTVSIDTLNTDEFDADIGAGKLLVTKGLSSTEVGCTVGAGSIDFGLLESSYVELECGAGEIKTWMSGGQSDYYLEGDCAIGEVRFGSQKFSGNVEDIAFGSGDNVIDVDCGVGRIDIQFQDSKV